MDFYDTVYEHICAITPVPIGDFDALWAILDKRTLKKGSYFAYQGRIEKKCGLLIKGVVRTFFRNKVGEEYIKSFGTPFSFVGGFSSLVSGQTNQISVQTIVDSIILEASYTEIIKLYQTYPSLETLGRRVAESLFVFKEAREIKLLSLTAEERYLEFREEYPTLEAIVPQYYIASYLGVTPTQLSRIRRKLLSQ
ncbi:MAG TPA: Crp/Fnr family transcriptional regulator [Microscillaceae bacterium]|nr:Crp/Fnr family transcriptional regulator [Microscillaceae bacterium]